MVDRKVILVTGGSGLVGSAIKSLSFDYPKFEFVFPDSKSYNLTRQDRVERMFEIYNPDMVIHCAARVGGIGRNLSTPAQQFRDNILMNTLVIDEAHFWGVRRMISFSSACAFPGDVTEQTEDQLHDRPPFPAHESYAYAKRMVDIQNKAYNKQYGTQYVSVIPGNIFGKRDNFDLDNGHVVPSLIRKCYEAKLNDEPFKIWGTGDACREFIYAHDVAKACIELLLAEKWEERVIVSGDKPVKIGHIAKIIANILEYNNLEYLVDKPEGQMYRGSDSSVLDELLPEFSRTSVDEALEKTIDWFVEVYPDVRGI